MRVLVRKITYANWEGVTSNEVGDLPADVFGCLKTSSNNLSVWIADLSDENSIENAKLAIVGSFNSPSHVEFLLLDYDRLVRAGFDVISSPKGATTSEQDLVVLHHDIIELSTSKLTKLATFIVGELNDRPELVTTFTRPELVDFMIGCLKSGKLKLDNVATKFLEPLCKQLNLKIDSIDPCGTCRRKDDKRVDIARKNALETYLTSFTQPS